MQEDAAAASHCCSDDNIVAAFPASLDDVTSRDTVTTTRLASAGDVGLLPTCLHVIKVTDYKSTAGHTRIKGKRTGVDDVRPYVMKDDDETLTSATNSSSN